jgi:hypothetical protein
MTPAAALTGPKNRLAARNKLVSAVALVCHRQTVTRDLPGVWVLHWTESRQKVLRILQLPLLKRIQ